VRIPVDPDTAALHETIAEIVSAHQLPVHVVDPGDWGPAPVTAQQIMASTSRAYTVSVRNGFGGGTVSRTGRYGLGGEIVSIPRPVEAATLVPLLREQLRLAAEEQARDLAQSGPWAAYEAVDAVRPV